MVVPEMWNRGNELTNFPIYRLSRPTEQLVLGEIREKGGRLVRRIETPYSLQRSNTDKSEPGRKVLITEIYRVDVRQESKEEILMGHRSISEFLRDWTAIYDRMLYYRHNPFSGPKGEAYYWNLIQNRPAHLYDAWKMWITELC